MSLVSPEPGKERLTHASSSLPRRDCRPRRRLCSSCRLRPRRSARRRRPASTRPSSPGLRWRSIGPARGGRSRPSPGSSSRRHEYYFGATGGGLWKTTDGGVTWRPVSDGFFKSSSVGAVAVAESQPDVVYVGMGEVAAARQRHPGRRRLQVGRRRQDVDARRPRDDAWSISRIRVHPANPDIVYVAALGDPYGPNPERGIFKSTDGGKTWEQRALPQRQDRRGRSVDGSEEPRRALRRLLGGLPHAALAVERRPGQRALQDDRRRQDLDRADEEPGAARHRSGARSACRSRAPTPIASTPSSKPPTAACSCRTMPARPGRASTTIAGCASARSTTRASTPTRRRATPSTSSTPASTARPTPARRSRAIRVPHGDNHDLWIAPTDPARMINGNDGGANVSINAGESWTDQDYPTAQFYNVFTTAHVPYHVCGAQQDNSTACVPSERRRRALRRRRRRERLHRARSAGRRRLLRRQLRRPADAHQPPHRRAARHQRLARQPDGLLGLGHHRALPVDVPDRHRADRSEDALRHLAARLEIRPTKARAGSGSAPT